MSYIDADGRERFQRAKAVVIAAYSIETPRLLLNSACSGFENGLANSSDCVGRYLMAQAGNVVAGRFEEPVRMYKAPPAHALTEAYYETDPKRDFARGFAIQTVGPLPIAFAKQMMTAKGAWGWGLRRVMMDYNHWAAFGFLGELLPNADNRAHRRLHGNPRRGCLHQEQAQYAHIRNPSLVVSTRHLGTRRPPHLASTGSTSTLQPGKAVVEGRTKRIMLLLGIETSCDDTATAVVRDGRTVLASVSTNQDAFHARYGGIVPEIAGRQHVALLSAAVEDALGRAAISLRELDGIAVTRGPGLIGSLVVGVAAAKALAFALAKPLYAVNHLHGHIFAAFLDREETPTYPLLALLVSGGHSQLVDVDSPTEMRVIGRTRDDAAGEAYDKTARLLGLGFPGGPKLDALAQDGNATAFAFPRHRPDIGSLDMSFSGLKTSVRYFLESPAGKNARPEDVAASFQAAVVDVLMHRVDAAFARRAYSAAVLSGGVAANSALQRAFADWGIRNKIATLIPPPKYCTDNAAMIAAVADRQSRAVRVDPTTLSADPNLPFELSLC
ncbi:MAG: tRNA (adenosine(37)-N6)-threonylcarbamoyltransferase complex transferase subunit TsaD [Candidatus Eremiobacteraeota bacterium]|nr:tRNA (adenosine(37)-N6)-threonylcarbamoyltransferase complex transferase subunit TsaD [Candidatus Eremiobacteraeota bacterium]